MGGQQGGGTPRPGLASRAILGAGSGRCGAVVCLVCIRRRAQRNVGLISGFTAGPGACKMVTFYCFLGFSFFLSCFCLFPPLLYFKFPPHATKKEKATTVPLGDTQICNAPADSAAAPRVPPAAGPPDPRTSPQGGTRRGAGLCFPCVPRPAHSAPRHLQLFLWELRAPQWLAGVSGVSLPLFFFCLVQF